MGGGQICLKRFSITNLQSIRRTATRTNVSQLPENTLQSLNKMGKFLGIYLTYLGNHVIYQSVLVPDAQLVKILLVIPAKIQN